MTHQSRSAQITEQEPEPAESWGSAIGRNPVVQTLAIMAVVSVAGWSVTGGIGPPDSFYARIPVTDPWWSLFTATYGHQNTGHFMSNAMMLVLAGGLISLSTSTLRFHLFFILTGVTAVLGQLYFAAAFGNGLGVIGSSGSTFALMGYLIGSTVGGVGGTRRHAAIVVVLLASVLTIWFSGPGTAYGGHFVGVFLGLIAGRLHLLRVE